MPGRAELAAGALLGLVLGAAAAAAEPAPDAAPDAGFLEFLGLLVEDGGEYVDPLDMADLSLPDAGVPDLDGTGTDEPLEIDDEHGE